MPQLGLLALGLALGLAVTVGPPRRTFALLVGTIVLLPATLPIPNGFTPYLSFHNVVIAGAVLAVVRGVREGTVRAAHLRVTPAQVALSVFCAVVLVDGVALAGPTTTLNDLQQGMVAILAQLVVLTLGVILVRAIDDHRFVIATLTASIVVSAGIATAEHVTGHSFGQFLFAHLHLVTDAAEPLLVSARRPPRVRAGAQFALQYGWMVVMLAPAVLVVPTLLRGRRAWWYAVPAVMTGASLYWSYSRSAVAVAPLAALAIWVGTRWNRRIGAGLALACFAVLTLLTVRPSITAALRPEADTGSIDSRAERLPLVGEAVAGRAVQGIGLGGLKQFGVSSTDASYIQVYAETGVIGLSAFVVAIAVSLVTAGRGLRAPLQPGRLLAAVGFGGALMGVVGSGAFDLFAVRGSAQLFWLLVAVGVVGSEWCRGSLPPIQRLSGRRWLLPAGGLALGLLLVAGVPARQTSTVRFLVSPLEEEVRGDPGLLGDRILGHTACDIARHHARGAGEKITCRELRLNRGVREIRFEAPDQARLLALETSVFAAVESAVPGARQRSYETEPTSFRPTAIRTAPLWLAWLGLSAALLLPGAALAPTLRRWDAEGWAPAPA